MDAWQRTQPRQGISQHPHGDAADRAAWHDWYTKRIDYPPLTPEEIEAHNQKVEREVRDRLLLEAQGLAERRIRHAEHVRGCEEREKKRTDGNQSNLFKAVVTNDYKRLHDVMRTDVDISCQDEEGDTVLHLAASVDSQLMVEELLLYKADKYIRNKSGELPWDVCSYRKIKALLLVPEDPYEYRSTPPTHMPVGDTTLQSRRMWQW
jgi:hypothetical protein